MDEFEVSVVSTDADWWRYNVAVTCGCFSKEGARVGFTAHESKVADIGAEVTPAEKKAKRNLTFRTGACDRIVMYLYIIPHTLPETMTVEDNPFEVEVHVLRGGKALPTARRTINRWSGASLELKFGAEEV